MPFDLLGVRWDRGSGCFCGVRGDCCWSPAGAAGFTGLSAAFSGLASTGESTTSRTVKPYVALCCFGGSVIMMVSCTTVVMLPVGQAVGSCSHHHVPGLT